MKHQALVVGLLVTAAVVMSAAGCTVKKQEPPPLAGPSGFARSIAVSVTPDVLRQDGVSQSRVVVTVRNKDGQPTPNQPLRAEIFVGGVPVDFGILSARNVVTGSDGTATLIYTAPPAPPVAVDIGTVVDIAVTPTDSGDFNNSMTRFASIRLVPDGVIAPPSGLAPHFTFSPATPLEGQLVFFEACNDPNLAPCAPPNNPVATYAWNFGDGSTASGPTVTHAFSTPGSYFVRLTITDLLGRSQSTTRTVTVGQSPAPVAAFQFSPNDPLVGQPINFNASASTAAPGRRIVSYTWDFGDGRIVTVDGPIISHTYALPRNYNVLLMVTDDIGRTATVSQSIEPKAGPAP